MAITLQRVVRLTLCLVIGSGFWERQIEVRTAPFPVKSNPRWWPAAILKKIQTAIISETHYPIHFMYVRRPHFVISLYNERWLIWQEIGYLFAMEGKLADLRYKGEEHKGRFGDRREDNAPGVLYILDWSQGHCCLFLSPGAIYYLACSCSRIQLLFNI